MQAFPLQGVVLQPALQVASPASGLLEFGGVHAAAPRTLELVVTNPTEADAAWTATIQPVRPLSGPAAAAAAAQAGAPQPARPVQVRRASCGSAGTCAAAAAAVAPSAFSVVPEQGVLPGRGLGMPRQQRLRVTFAPRSSGPCAAELVLAVAGGGVVCVALQGEGVHAERAEARTAYDL